MLQRCITKLAPFGSVAPFSVFHSTGMLMARPMPLQEGIESEAGTSIAREGYVSVTVIPRLAPVGEESGIFEKDKKISVKLRTKQIGQIIAWKLGKIPLSLTAYSKSDPIQMELTPKGESLVELALTPKASHESGEPVLPVSITMDIGEIKSFQILLEAALPHLYGWVGPNTSPKKYSSATSSKSPEDFFKQFTA